MESESANELGSRQILIVADGIDSTAQSRNGCHLTAIQLKITNPEIFRHSGPTGAI